MRENNATNYTVIDGVTYSADKRVLIKYPEDKADETFYVPDFVEEIGEEAFEGNRKLKNLYVGKNTKTIGYGALGTYNDKYPEYIEKIYVSPSVTDIPHIVFPYEFGWDWVTYAPMIVGGVKGSCVEAHANERSITFVEVEQSKVQEFFQTPTEVLRDTLKRQIEEENEYIVDASDCGYIAKIVGDTLEILPSPGTTAPVTVQQGLYANFCDARRAKIKRVVFGDGICGVGKYEFIDDRYKNLTSIHLGADMEFDATSFFGMYGLSEITCSEDNLQYQVIDNVLYSRDLKTLIRYTPGKPEAFFSVPDHVERLEHYAFMYANKLQCVKVGKNVKSIGNQCFDNCHDLRHIYIGEGVESIEGEYIFALSDYDGRIYLTREGLVIGGKAQSAAERWCAEINKLCCEYREELVCDFFDAITFSLIEDDEIDKFLTIPLPDLRDDKYLAKYFDTKDKIERNRPRLPNNDLPF